MGPARIPRSVVWPGLMAVARGATYEQAAAVAGVSLNTLRRRVAEEAGGDRQTVSHAGTHLLGELADQLGVTSAYSAAVPWNGERAFGHDRGRLLAQVV